MKARRILLLAILLCSFQVCLTQTEIIKENKLGGIKVNSRSKEQPHFILKVDDKTLKIGMGLLGKVKLEDINVEWISAVEVWKDQKATERYGEEAKGGLVVITFKDFNMLSKELQDMFNKVPKKIE